MGLSAVAAAVLIAASAKNLAKAGYAIGCLPRVTEATPIAKKGAQQIAGAPLLDPAIDFGPVVGGRLVEQARAMLDRAAFRVVGAEIEPAQAGQGDRRGAHRARLEGNVEIALGEMLGGELRGAGTQYQHLGMRGRIVLGLDAVAGGGEKTALTIDQYGANRYLAVHRRRLGF